MTLSIQITDSIDKIEKNVNQAIANYINDVCSRNKINILNQAKALIPNWIRSQPEIQSLLSSDSSSLAGQFGIKGDTSSIVNDIISSVVDSTSIKFIPYSKTLKGGLELEFQPANFSNLLSLRSGHTIYSGGDLHWLDWLLKRGDSIIVTNYQYNPATGFGRSGLGNMVGGGSFRVPPQFSGTSDDNFITRSFTGTSQEQALTRLFTNILT
jgi:hypothetical protein